MDRNINAAIGKQIKLARLARDWTRADLARRAGVHKLTIDRIENARTPPQAIYAETIIAIARALGCSTDQLLLTEPLIHNGEAHVLF